MFRTYPILSRVLVGMFAMIVVGIAGVASLAYANKSDNNSVAGLATVDLNGSWKSKDGKFSAIITTGDIEVSITTDESSSLYWKGTFTTVPLVVQVGSVELKSQGDVVAMNQSLFGSKDSTKTFVYYEGDLSFKMTMLGTTTVIHLKKQ